MSDLSGESCKPMEKGTPPLSADEAGTLSRQINSDWQIQQDPAQIQRTFKFKNYYHTIAFVNAVAWIANQEDHHPDLEVSYNRCVVHFSTHSIGGLSENDFICAAKIDALFPEQ
ncbi:MAG: 4a-hydroxytetrahydrobiopterin dehydratase [Gammaproteobacteria bacterium]